MASIFDLFGGNASPEQNAGLLGLAAGFNGALGDGSRPVNFGQALAAGALGMQQGRNEYADRERQKRMLDLQAQLYGYKAQDAESDYAFQQAGREREQRIADRLAGVTAAAAGNPQQAGQQPSMASAMPGTGLSPKTGGPDWLQAYQQQNGMQQPTQEQAPRQSPTNRTDQVIERLYNEAQVRFEEGDSKGATVLMEQIAKLRPEFDQTPRTGQDAQGNPFTYVLDKQGNPKVIQGVLPRDELEFRDGGGTVLGLDKFTGRQRSAVAKTLSPTDRVAMRGQDLVSDRAAEANAINARGTLIGTSTGLRKEFDDLPEVKSYKQALPAYTAIKDAVTRNTPQSDINIVYGIAKLYDPNSVVREGEYATVANSPNIPDKIKGYASYLQGGGRLTGKVKSELLAEATGRIKSFEAPYVAARSNYSTISQNSGADPSLLFPTAHQSPVAPVKKTASLADIAETARKSGKSTQQVTADLRAKGYEIGGK